MKYYKIQYLRKYLIHNFNEKIKNNYILNIIRKFF